MRRVDAYLTTRAQAAWPESVVYRQGGGGAFDTWYLDRGPRYELAELGEGFHRARETLRLLLAAEAAREADV